MSAAKDLADWLIAQGRGTAIGTDVFVNFMPDTPDAALVLFDTGGPPASRAFGNRVVAVRHLGVQVLVRRAKGRDAEAEASVIWALLDGWTGTGINGVTYLLATCRESAPFLLDRDSRNRTTFVFNVILERLG